MLERREVLSGATLTLTQAQQDVAAAQSSLNGSISGYLSAIVGLEGQLDSFLSQHQSSFNTQASGVVGTFTALATTTSNAANTLLMPFEGQFQADLEQIDLDLADDLEDAEEQLQTDWQTEVTALDADLEGIQTSLDNALEQADKNFANKVDFNWNQRIQAEVVEENTLSLAENGAEETRVKDFGAANVQFSLDRGVAVNTRDKKINLAEFNRATNTAFANQSFTSNRLTFAPQLFADIANGTDALYTSYHAGNADQAAVSGVWTQYAVQAGNAWASFAAQDAQAWQNYATGTVSDWKGRADYIADAAQDVGDLLAPEYQTMVDQSAVALHGYWDTTANDLLLRNQTISTSIRNHSQQANAEVYASQDLLAGKVRIAEDKVTNDRHAAATNLLGKELNFTTNMLVTSLPFEQQLVGSFAGTLSSVRGLLNTQLNDDLVSYNAIYRQATTTDDGIFTAWTHRQTKQSVLSLVQQRDDVTNTPLGQINAPSRVPAIAMLNDGTHASDPTLVARRRELVNTFLAKRTN